MQNADTTNPQFKKEKKQKTHAQVKNFKQNLEKRSLVKELFWDVMLRTTIQ